MTVDDYIDSLPEDRRIAIRAVREAINAKLPAGYEEGIVYDMISWFVPFTRLAETYNGQPLCVASLGSQKGYMVLHLMSVYGDAKLRQWFEKAFKASGKKLDMGKGCLRFKTLDDLPLPVISEVIAKVPVDAYVAAYEKVRASTATGKKAAAKAKATAAAKKVEAKAKKVVAKAKAKVTAKTKAVAAKTKAAAGKAKSKLAAAAARAKSAAKKRPAARA